MKKNPNALRFEDYCFDVEIKDEIIGIGYYFEIEEKMYYQDVEKMFSYHPNNMEELKFLITDWRGKWYDSDIAWRDVSPPFRIIKKKKSDTLLLIKEGKEFLFIKKNRNW